MALLTKPHFNQRGFLKATHQNTFLRMILGAHVIISAYGFWLPNDPRGSWSDFVAAWELLKFGKATKATTRDSVANVPHDAIKRREAKSALKYPPVLFTGEQAVAIGGGFARAVREGAYRIHACSILPDHVHFVAAAHQRRYEQMTAHLKAHATRELTARGIHPLGAQRGQEGRIHSPWAESLWKVFIDNDAHFRAAIQYVEDNPLKEGKAKQHWPRRCAG